MMGRTIPAVAAAALAALLAAAPAAAQRPDPPRDTGALPLDTLEVTVARGLRPLSRVPVAATVVERDAIQRAQPSLSLEESLRRLPGVVVDHRHNYSVGDRISIRGFGTRAAFGVRGVRVIADGIPLTTADGQTNLNNIDLASAGRIEVIRGPASSLYGNAAGGVISITTEDAPAGAFSLQGRGVLGDYGASLGNLTRGEARIGGRGDRWSYLVSAAHTDADGYREHSRVRQSLLNARGRFAIGPRSALTLVVNGADVPVAQNPGALPIDSVETRPRAAWPRNVETGAGSTTRQLQAGLVLAHALDHGRLELAAHGARRELENPLPFGVIGLERWAGGARGSMALNVTEAPLPLAITAGFDAEMQSDERTEHNNAGGRPGDQLRRDQTDAVASIGPFAEFTALLAPGVEATLGGRYDVVRFRTTDRFLSDGRDDSGERTLSAFSPMVGLTVRLSPTTTLYANAATSFQTPTTTELINAPPAAGEACCPGGFNAHLEPQRARSFEVGARARPLPTLEVEVTAYAMRIRDALVPFQVPEVEAREFFRNAGRSRHDGVELLTVWAPVHTLELHGAYTFSDFRYVDAALPGGSFAGNRYPGVAPHRIAAGVVARPGAGVRLAADAVHTSEFDVTDANDRVNPSATVLHLRAEASHGWRGTGLRPFAGIQNVTDARYNAAVVLNAAGGRFYEPAPGRAIYLGVTAGTGGWQR